MDDVINRLRALRASQPVPPPGAQGTAPTPFFLPHLTRLVVLDDAGPDSVKFPYTTKQLRKRWPAVRQLYVRVSHSPAGQSPAGNCSPQGWLVPLIDVWDPELHIHFTDVTRGTARQPPWALNRSPSDPFKTVDTPLPPLALPVAAKVVRLELPTISVAVS